VAMLVDTQLAFLTGIITALFAGMLAPTGMQKALFAMVSCSAAIYGIGRYRERQSVTLAGLLVAARRIKIGGPDLAARWLRRHLAILQAIKQCGVPDGALGLNLSPRCWISA